MMLPRVFRRQRIVRRCTHTGISVMEWLPLIFLIAVLVWAIWAYNRLIMRRNRVATAWSDIDVQLTRRHDLIPNLVKVVSRYTEHESMTLEKVTRLRTQALSTESPERL